MTFKIWNDGDQGRMTFVEIDGEDVSGRFNDLRITAGVNSAVQVELDMPLHEVRKWEWEPATLTFPMPGTRELLIKHGWTPPAE